MHYLLAKQEVREFLLLWFTLRVQITLSPGGAEFVGTAASVFCTTTIAPRRETQLETEKIYVSLTWCGLSCPCCEILALLYFLA